MPVTYWGYLQLKELLSLQKPLSDGPEHDELLFIVIHQVYELWFKQVLHEVSHLQRLLEEDRTPAALNTLKRVLTILKIMVAQIDILETMTPLDFLSFRERLESGSGFESYQFREVEFLLGHKRPGLAERYPEDHPARARLSARYAEPTLWDSFLAHLANQGHPVPRRLLDRDRTEPVQPSEEVQKILIDVYREGLLAAQLCERLIDLDEGMQEWRYRHVKMVERTIGMKQGTGGSSGAAYLRTTLFRPVFPDLWAIRTEL